MENIFKEDDLTIVLEYKDGELIYPHHYVVQEVTEKYIIVGANEWSVAIKKRSMSSGENVHGIEHILVKLNKYDSLKVWYFKYFHNVEAYNKMKIDKGNYKQMLKAFKQLSPGFKPGLKREKK